MSLYNLPNENFSNVNLNSVGSQYAQDYGHNISLLIAKETKKKIFDASPQQFYDLTIFNQIGMMQSSNDEFFYKEFGYQRQPLIATANSAAVTYPTTQTITVQSTTNIATDMMITYQNGQIGNVIAVNSGTNQVTVIPQTNDTLPAVTSGDIFALLSTVEADGVNDVGPRFRLDTIERNGFVQLFSRAIRYGMVEKYKMEKGYLHPDFLSQEREQMYKQHRIDLSNAFWMGRKGEIQTASGLKAKTTDGVFTMMQNAGSPNVTTTTATLADALEDVVLSTQYGDYGEVKFAYMTPRMQNEVRKAYTDQLIRYKPENPILANLHLSEINIGSTRVVIVPFQRFASNADFYPGFENRIVLLDHTTIEKRELWGVMSGETPDRKQGFLNSYTDMWVACQLGIGMNNPMASGWVDVTI